MIEKPLVSVLMCVYNGQRFLRQAIESVLAQTYSNFELIIIDDASVDSSRQIIESFSDTRIQTVYRKTNGNICVAGNQAFQIAFGKYCALIGHDDIWEKDKLEKQVEFMEKNISYAVCFTRCAIINENDEIIECQLGNLFDQIKNQNRISMFRELFYENNKLCAPSAMIRKDIIDELGGYEYSLLQLQDYNLWLRILGVADIYIYEEKLTLYRRATDTKENISSDSENNINRIVHEDLYIIEKLLNEMPDERFVDFFVEDFVYKEARTPDELKCERAYVLKKKGNYYYLRNFMTLLDNAETRHILLDKYNLDPVQFYEMNGNTVFWEKSVYDKMNQMENLLATYKHSMEQYKNIAEKQQEILNKISGK